MTLKHKLAFRVGSTTIGRNLFLVTLNANISQTIKKGTTLLSATIFNKSKRQIPA